MLIASKSLTKIERGILVPLQIPDKDFANFLVNIKDEFFFQTKFPHPG